VDGEWRGITVEAIPKEKHVIDFDLTEQERSSLPGAGRSTTFQETNGDDCLGNAGERTVSMTAAFKLLTNTSELLVGYVG